MLSGRKRKKKMKEKERMQEVGRKRKAESRRECMDHPRSFRRYVMNIMQHTRHVELGADTV